MKSVIEEVAETVRERGKVYGPPHVNMNRTAALWSAFLGIPVTGAQVAACMMLVKIARLSESPAHRDSILDIGGYTHCYDDCIVNGGADANGQGGKT